LFNKAYISKRVGEHIIFPLYTNDDASDKFPILFLRYPV
jgi:hypothetical protein